MPAADGDDAYRGPPIASWCKVRPGRFFWGVWSSHDPHREAPPVACGFEPTHDAAKAKAEAGAGPRGRVDSSYAGTWHAWNRDVFRPHFARCRIGDGRGYWVAWRWFDVRTGQHGESTSGVAADPDAAEAAARAVAGPDAVDLGSKIASAHRRGDFRPDRPAGPLSRAEADAFATLDLVPPCGPDEVKNAYRRRAMDLHPDRGGDAGDFVELEAAYRAAMAYCARPRWEV